MNQPILLTTVLGAGLLDSFNPCAISVALLFIATMFTLKKDRRNILKIGAAYIISIYVTYFLIGLGLLNTFALFGIPHFIGFIGAFIVIFFGILNLKEYFFPNWTFLRIKMPVEARHKIGEWAYKASIPAAIVVGILVGIFEFPCSGAVYIAVLSLLSVKATFVGGVVYLALYNIMFVLPLVLIFLFTSRRAIVEKMINDHEREGKKMHLILAALMIGLGVLMLVYYL